ncbi:MAG: hypothetical protein ACU837_15365 [Gammaproteobacteria bacterium]
MSLRNFLKENAVLVMGLTLPVILVLLFFAAVVVPKWLTPPPQYSLLFTVSRYDYSAPFQTDFVVVDGVLKVRVGKNDDNNRSHRPRKLMLYDAENESGREIAYDVAKLSALAEAGGGELVVEDTRHLHLDPSFKAPDGYTFEGGDYRHYGLLQGLFGGYRQSGARLKKDAVAYKIALPAYNGSYYYGDMQFIGWIVKQ